MESEHEFWRTDIYHVFVRGGSDREHGQKCRRRAGRVQRRCVKPTGQCGGSIRQSSDVVCLGLEAGRQEYPAVHAVVGRLGQMHGGMPLELEHMGQFMEQQPSACGGVGLKLPGSEEYGMAPGKSPTAEIIQARMQPNRGEFKVLAKEDVRPPSQLRRRVDAGDVRAVEQGPGKRVRNLPLRAFDLVLRWSKSNGRCHHG